VSKKKYDKIEATLKKTIKEPRVKNPRVPVFPPAAQATYDLLNDIVTNDADNDRRCLAYGLMTRLCVLWVPGVERLDVVVKATLDPLMFDLSENSQIIQDVMRIMTVLFPDGEGLPELSQPL